MLLPRMIEEKMILLLRQNRISKWFSGIGQEAISVGTSILMNKDEHILPMHRNLGVFTNRGIPLRKLFSQWQGKENGFTKGRDRSFHFGTKDYNLVGMISHLGPQLGVADGIALASKLKKQKNVTMVFTGDGGTSEGDFHEAINVAAVWDLPVIFVIENNGYGLSTPSSEQFKFNSFTVKGPAYGIDAYSVDGNNILEVYSKIDEITRDIRKNPKPVILEAMTFRMRGHEESSGTKYIPKKLMQYWERRDPVQNYELFLKEINIIDDTIISEIRNEYSQYIDSEIDIVYSEEEIEPSLNNELSDVFAPYLFQKQEESKITKELRLVDAISDGLDEAMKKFPQLILMGQDIADYGGVFKVTEGLLEKYGRDRVRNTPLCESAIIGTALGLSIKGMKAVSEMQFADFVSSGFTQVVNNLAKIHYRWGQNADVVLRMPTGADVGAGPFHSQSNEGWFLKVPGLKIFYPSNPKDAKGLLLSAIEDPNPVLFFEHKALYRKISSTVPEGYYNLEPGKAMLVNEGNDATVITYGYGVHWAKEIIDENNYNVDLIDLRTLVPLDKDSIEKSIKKTGKVIILHEDTITLGIGAEIAAWISQDLFTYLDAPVIRTGSLDTPVPFARNLEKQFLPKDRFKLDLKKLLDW
ncbi:dehydrogenase E1 component subunit alpha/beta [Candidatus Kapabacteria bacterium]|nr:dehydrogenase E1 component subunit alpha/beta [Candidatus Kapabacteria bacterium]